MIVSRVAAAGLSAAAILTFLAPAASANHRDGDGDRDRGRLTVCVFGLDRGDRARVDIDGRSDRDDRIRGCETFRLREGRYTVDVDPPRGYRVRGGDDDRRVWVEEGDRAFVSFSLRD
jgi:hypothetical protein